MYADDTSLYTNLYFVTNLCIMADFQTLNCRYSFGIQCGLKLHGMIYFHNKIWNHWVIYSYFEYIRHYAPVALLICCDNIKGWSIQSFLKK